MHRRAKWVNSIWIVAVFAAATLAVPAECAAETWLCPFCQKERIERVDLEASFDCPRCQASVHPEDLRIPVAHICIRTRPTQTVWEFAPECGTFRNEGLQSFPRGGPIWVPWSAVDYYIPRQRILRLTSGEELLTPYAMGPDCPKEEQPLILATIADSVGDFQRGFSLETRPTEETISALFIVARSRVALDSARVRFIREVETGKHPRLPRTPPQVLRLTNPTVPPGLESRSFSVELAVRIDDRGQVLKVHRLKGSGNIEIDRAALHAAYRNHLVAGGEMGVGVPCSMILRYRFEGGAAEVEAEPAMPFMWTEWVEPPL